MIAAILPSTVVAVETRDFESDSLLFDSERAAVVQAVEKRRRDFATGRSCAHAALAQLGRPAGAVARTARGEPQWPAGVVGSITHTDGYCACAVAEATDIVTLGIDAEPHAPLPARVPVASIACVDELSALERMRRQAPDVEVDRLLFSAKESVFKAWYPLTKRELDFEDAMVRFDAAGTFDATVLVADPMVAGRSLDVWSGRWIVCEGLVLTAVTLAPAVADQECPSRPGPADVRPVATRRQRLSGGTHSQDLGRCAEPPKPGPPRL